VAERREVAELHAVLAGDGPLGADGGKGLGLLDGVDAEVGLEVEIQLQHLGGITGLLGDDPEHLRDNGIVLRGGRGSDCGRGGSRSRDGRNGGGDRYYTDGELFTGVLSSDNAVQSRPPDELPAPAAITVKNWFFSGLRPLLRASQD